MREKIIVVGGSSGMGLAAARRFHAEGYQVTISSRSRARIDSALAEVGGGTGYVLDYTQPDTVPAFFKLAGAHHHLVLAAAGAPAWGPFEGLSQAQFRTAFDTKFWGYVSCLQSALPKLEPSGSVILVGGAAARAAMPGTAGLAAVNGAIERMGITLARELAPRRVNVLSPGLVDTPAYDAMPEAQRSGMYRDAAARLPAGRIGKPADIAEALLFLVRDGYVTGTVLEVDGGAHLG
jgi:NAD(P)-dependent dehydrogenase (short-subunit alcohol dehydrogenase family)